MVKPRRTTLTLVLSAFALGAIVGGMAAARLMQPAQTTSPTSSNQALVTGIGGIFFKADDPQRSRQWYREHLGMDGQGPGINFFWREQDDSDRYGFTVWSVFPKDTDYFGPNGQAFMINYRVRDLDALLERLRDRGVRQVGETEEYWYGRFAWVLDGDGNRIELWEPIYYPPEEFEQRLRN